jgi:hypothetical protein
MGKKGQIWMQQSKNYNLEVDKRQIQLLKIPLILPKAWDGAPNREKAQQIVTKETAK